MVYTFKIKHKIIIGRYLQGRPGRKIQTAKCITQATFLHLRHTRNYVGFQWGDLSYVIPPPHIQYFL